MNGAQNVRTNLKQNRLMFPLNGLGLFSEGYMNCKTGVT